MLYQKMKIGTGIPTGSPLSGSVSELCMDGKPEHTGVSEGVSTWAATLSFE